MIGYVKHFQSNKTLYLKVTDNKLSKKYIKIWEKISSVVGKKFGSEPLYGDSDKYIKAKIKTYRDEVKTNFQGKKIPKENTFYKCLPFDNSRFCC